MTAKTVREIVEEVANHPDSYFDTREERTVPFVVHKALEQIRAVMPSVKDIMDEIELRHGCTVEMYETATAIRELIEQRLK